MVSNEERKLFVAAWVQLSSVTWFQLKSLRAFLNFWMLSGEKFLDSYLACFSFVLLKLSKCNNGKWSDSYEHMT